MALVQKEPVRDLMLLLTTILVIGQKTNKKLPLFPGAFHQILQRSLKSSIISLKNGRFKKEFGPEHM